MLTHAHAATLRRELNSFMKNIDVDVELTTCWWLAHHCYCYCETPVEQQTHVSDEMSRDRLHTFPTVWFGEKKRFFGVASKFRKFWFCFHLNLVAKWNKVWTFSSKRLKRGGRWSPCRNVSDTWHLLLSSILDIFISDLQPPASGYNVQSLNVQTSKQKYTLFSIIYVVYLRL